MFIYAAHVLCSYVPQHTNVLKPASQTSAMHELTIEIVLNRLQRLKCATLRT